jgi:hypothetical protein
MILKKCCRFKQPTAIRIWFKVSIVKDQWWESIRLFRKTARTDYQTQMKILSSKVIEVEQEMEWKAK